MKEQAKYIRAHGGFLGRYGTQYRPLNRLGTALYDELVHQLDGYCGVELRLIGDDSKPRLNIIFYLDPPPNLVGKLLRSEWVFFLDPRTLTERMDKTVLMVQTVRQMVESAKSNLDHVKEATERLILEGVNV